MKKNTKLIIILSIQLILVVSLYFADRDSSKLDFDNKLFTVADTSSISKMELLHGEKLVTLESINNQWFINGKEEADQALVAYIKSVMNRVAVTRPISSKQQEIVYSQLKTDGVLVRVFQGEELKKEFYAGGNEARTKSYFATEGKSYLVNVPGYQDYLSGIFKLKAHQWKERLLFSSSWRSVGKIEIDKKSADGFKILFTGKDLTVEGVVPLDTNIMMNYIAQYQNFKINEFIEPGQFERYDSLVQTQPIAKIILEDLDASKNLKISILPRLPNEGFHLMVDENKRMMMVDRKRISNLIPPRKVFVKREAPNFNRITN